MILLQLIVYVALIALCVYWSEWVAGWRAQIGYIADVFAVACIFALGYLVGDESDREQFRAWGRRLCFWRRCKTERQHTEACSPPLLEPSAAERLRHENEQP